MRKNIFNTVAGVLVAVSMLFAAIGCTNINDPETLKNDSFTVNKMAIAGFKVTGLDGVFDHATVQLKGADDAVIAEGFIADDDDDLTPGSAFVKLETPYIFDAGENSPKDFECYLEVVKSGVKLADIKAVDPEDLTAVANAKLPIIPSPYGTKDADLAKRYVDVQVSNGVGTFSFSEDLSASLRFSYTSLGSHDWAEISTADWATVTSVAKTDATYAKYKITINNLEKDEDGMRYILTGSTIAPLNDKSIAGDYWYGNAKDEGAYPKIDAFISEVEDGTITFEFYAGGASFDASKGCAIKISAVDDPMKSDPWLCLLTGPEGGNLFLPIDKDYTVVIDAKKAKAEYKFSAVNERFVKVANFTLKGKDIAEDAGAGYVAFCANWLPKNEWGATTPNKVAFDDVEVVGGVGTATIDLGGVELWAGKPDTFIDVEMQVLNPQTDKDFWADDAKVMASFKVHFDDKWIGKSVTIIYDVDNDVVTIMPEHYLYVVGYEIKNLDDNGKKYYIMSQSPADSGNAQPGNAWSTATTIFGTVAESAFTTACDAWLISDEVQVQVKKTKLNDQGEDEIDWGTGYSITTSNFKSMNVGANCVVVVDATAGTAEFVAN